MAYRVAYIDNSDTGGIACRLTKPESANLPEEELLDEARRAIIAGGYYDKVEDGQDGRGRPQYRDATIAEMMKKVVIGEWSE